MGGRKKRQQTKKSGKSGFIEFPRPLYGSLGGVRKFILPLPYYVVFNYTGRAGSVAISKFFVNTAAVNLQSAGFDGNMKMIGEC